MQAGLSEERVGLFVVVFIMFEFSFVFQVSLRSLSRVVKYLVQDS